MKASCSLTELTTRDFGKAPRTAHVFLWYVENRVGRPDRQGNVAWAEVWGD